MARHSFHGQIAAEAGTQSTDVVIKSQLDAGVADAKNRAQHTGVQPVSSIDGFAAAVDTRVQLIVDAAPAALDTLNELAAALGDDPNFSATITTQLGDLDTRIDALEGASSVGGYKTTIGDAAASTFVVTHNLNTTDVMVEVVLLSTGQTVYPVITRPSVNTVNVDFGATVPPAGSYRVLVRAA
jgi:hypothetical protein